jgi:nogalonic acid methyl ester cyclase / aklanonic acid methyl ester cyclase
VITLSAPPINIESSKSLSRIKMPNNEIIAAVRKMFEAIRTGDVNDVTDYISKDYVNLEAMDDDEERSSLTGPEEFVATVKLLRSAFSDIHYEEQEIIVEENRVAMRTVETGRHTGPFFGIAPTGRSFTHEQAHFFHVVNGKVTEHKAVRDDLGLMLQLGAMKWNNQV